MTGPLGVSIEELRGEKRLRRTVPSDADPWRERLAAVAEAAAPALELLERVTPDLIEVLKEAVGNRRSDLT